MARVYDRAEPLREGIILDENLGSHTMKVQWDDGEEEVRDIDSLGHVPTSPEEIAAAKARMSKGWTGITAIGESGDTTRIRGSNPRDTYQE